MSEWKRTRCESGNCVEASAIGQGAVYLRSSLAPDVLLPVTREEWEAFVAGVKAGDFDDV